MQQSKSKNNINNTSITSARKSSVARKEDPLDEDEDQEIPPKVRVQEMKCAEELDLELARLEANKKTSQINNIEEL